MNCLNAGRQVPNTRWLAIPDRQRLHHRHLPAIQATSHKYHWSAGIYSISITIDVPTPECRCYQLFPSPAAGGGDIGYSARLYSPEGAWVNASGTLEPLEPAGHFSQQLNFAGWVGPAVDYTVIHLDQDSAIE